MEHVKSVILVHVSTMYMYMYAFTNQSQFSISFYCDKNCTCVSESMILFQAMINFVKGPLQWCGACHFPLRCKYVHTCKFCICVHVYCIVSDCVCD